MIEGSVDTVSISSNTLNISSHLCFLINSTHYGKILPFWHLIFEYSPMETQRQLTYNPQSSFQKTLYNAI